MNILIRYPRVLLTAVFLIVLSWYAMMVFNQSSEPPITPSQEVDFVLTNLSVKHFDENGQLYQELQSPKLRHFPKDNQHKLSLPSIKIIEPNQLTWTIHARNATAFSGGKMLAFNHDVIIKQTKLGERATTQLKTDNLLYNPKSQMAYTLSSVHLLQAENHIEAKGFKASLQNKHIQLLSQARGHYEPKQG